MTPVYLTSIALTVLINGTLIILVDVRLQLHQTTGYKCISKSSSTSGVDTIVPIPKPLGGHHTYQHRELYRLRYLKDTPLP